MLYDDNKVINYFNSRDEFIKEIDKIDKGIQKLMLIKKGRDKKEIDRMCV